eukprot:228792-Prymnesium_polylepis.1
MCRSWSPCRPKRQGRREGSLKPPPPTRPSSCGTAFLTSSRMHAGRSGDGGACRCSPSSTCWAR